MQMFSENLSRATSAMRATRISPHSGVRSIELANADFVRRFALVEDDVALQQYLDIRCASCAAHAYSGFSENVVTLAADLIGWLFLFDDGYGEGRREDDMRSMMQRFATYEAIMAGQSLTHGATRFHHALSELTQRGRQLGGERWQRRWAASMARYFDGCTLELPYRRSGEIPSLAQYRELRTWSVGTMACFAVSELGLSRPLSDDEATHPAVVAATELAAMLTAWVNDVYSFSKEHQARDGLNLVAVLANEYDLSVEAAFGAASDVYNDDLAAFESAVHSAHAALPDSTAVVEYTAALSNWIHGNHAWTATCGRYR